MRGGKFLAEESPDNLLQQYSCDTLEDVFLKLSVIQNKGKRRRSSIVQEISDQVSVPALTVCDRAHSYHHTQFLNDIYSIQNPALDLGDEDLGEISGEFGDSISMTGRAIDTLNSASDLPTPPLPPVDVAPMTLRERICFLNGSHMKAQIWKNFLWMWRNVG